MTRFFFNSRLYIGVCAALFATLCFTPSPVPVVAQGYYNQPPPGNCDGFNPNDPYGLQCGTYSGLSPRDPRFIVARVINVSLSLLGILATAIIIFAGFRWMTAGGNEDQVRGARQMIIAAVIGLAIIMSAYAISNFVLLQLNEAVR